MTAPRKKLIVIGSIVLLIAAIGVFIGAQVNNAYSRTIARTAASSYTTAAHTYLKKAAPLLNIAGSSTTSNAQSAAAIKTIGKMAIPQLAVVHGAGSKQKTYMQAVAYSKQVDAFVDTVKRFDIVSDQYQATFAAYLGLYNLEETGIPQMNTTANPTGLLTGFVSSLTAQRQALQQAKLTDPTLKNLATITEQAETDYISAFTSLLNVLASGSLHSVNYNYYPEVMNVYNVGQNYANQLNSQAMAMQSQALALAAKS